MNCSEVVEMMQRHLDNDLDGTETDLLTEHTQHCPACAEIYERLARLSSELEQLPKVTPRFSIVDSILPALDRLDMEGQSSATAPAVLQHSLIHSETEKVSHIDSSVASKQTDSSRDQQPGQPLPIQRKRWTDRFKWRTVGAVTAAGVMFGLFIVSYKPQVHESADFNELKDRAIQQHNELPATKQVEQQPIHNPHGQQNHGKPEAVPKAGDQPVEEETAQDTGAVDSGKPNPKQPKNDEPVYRQPSSQVEADRKRNDGTTGHTGQQSGHQERTVKVKKTEDKGSIPYVSKIHPETTTNPSKNDKSVVTPPAVKKGQEPDKDGTGRNDASATVQPHKPSIIPDKDVGVQESTDEAAIVPETAKISTFDTKSVQTTSADGKWLVRYDQGKLILFAIKDEQQTEVQSISFSYEPVDWTWSADNAQLTITTSNDAAKAQVFRVSEQGIAIVEEKVEKVQEQEAGVEQEQNDK
ncbi:anti-sigma factor family protein [Paenibacillus sp. 481]|uniref:anti-sigma factor family protein n=1 Tax=Paenibacillus sp. 481 TaxID=2835869 RepID=UPI001E4FA700|nr:zf-HC2 domain-containing protein [Paenibacillus sp. 481]UHA74218.1 zf-HC2 domain-containing protein [Paenibacillus sp. 481]